MNKTGGEKLAYKKQESRKRVLLSFLFLGYLCLVIKLFIFKYPFCQLKAIMDTWEKSVVLEGLDTANFTLFKTIKMYVHYSYKLNSFENLVGNVMVFVPFGYLLPFIRQRTTNLLTVLCYSFLFSFGIELFQLFSAFGAFDVDDLLLNTIGALLGYLILVANNKIYKLKV